MRRPWFIAAVTAVGVLIALFVGSAFRRTGSTSQDLTAAGRNPFVLPSLGADPFGGDGARVSLSEATGSADFNLVLPNDSLASDSTVDDVFEESPDHLAVTYGDGLRIYAESWEGIDGPALYKTWLSAGYKGTLVDLGGVTGIVSEAGTNTDGSTYPATLQFTDAGVTYKLLALPDSSLSSSDLVTVGREMIGSAGGSA